MKTILVVDDDVIFRTIAKRCLNQLGFKVLELESGKEVIRQVRSCAIEAIILDIIMDEQEGIETIRQLMDLSERPKIVAVSSNVFYLEMAMGFGVDSVLTKPIACKHLEEVLNKLGITA